MKRCFLRLAMAGVVLLAPAAGSAHTPSGHASCNMIGDESEVSAAGLYVDSETGPGIWRETNGWPGLQTHRHTCTVKKGSKSWVRRIKRDTRVA